VIVPFRLFALAATVSAGAGLAAGEARAACSEVIFSCNLGDKEPDGSPVWRAANLRSLRSSGRNDSWIARHCKVAYAEPSGCSWRGGGGSSAGSVGGASIVLSPAEPAPTPSVPLAAPSAPRRDAWGRRSPTPAPARDPPAPEVADSGPYAVEIAVAAQRYRLPALLIRAVMHTESGDNPEVVSNKGAVGLMQLLPMTGKALGVADLRDPAQNILGGARFLRILANRFDGDLVKVLSAYHAGSMRVVERDATPFAATDDYVRKVLKTYYRLRDVAQRASEGG